MKKNHWMWMVIGCGLPLLFIFLAPSLGISSGPSLFTFIILMFAIHLFMPHGSHGHDSQNHKDHKQKESAEQPIDKHKGDQHN